MIARDGVAPDPSRPGLAQEAPRELLQPVVAFALRFRENYPHVLRELRVPPTVPGRVLRARRFAGACRLEQDPSGYPIVRRIVALRQVVVAARASAAGIFVDERPRHVSYRS